MISVIIEKGLTSNRIQDQREYSERHALGRKHKRLAQDKSKSPQERARHAAEAEKQKTIARGINKTHQKNRNGKGVTEK